jgi:DNA adenine methylase
MIFNLKLSIVIYKMSKPILKWVGGKTQIIDKVMSYFPTEINNYHEPFLGGGSVLLALLNKVKNNSIKINGNIYAYDYNEALIYFYKNIQTDYITFYNTIKEYIDEYNSFDEMKGEDNSKEAYYYFMRTTYNSLENKKSMDASAMFLFLNKTCFRGMYRVGPKGYNVPFGNYKTPEIVNLEHLKEINILIKDVIFECCDYSISLSRVNENDTVYLDPPYAPENEKSFVGYTDKGFNIKEHNNLFKICKSLKNINFIMSNSNVELVTSAFEEYNIDTVICKRSINSKNPESKTTEVIITSYF